MTFDPSLAEWLSVDQKAIRQVLNRLAFEAHQDQRALVGTADITENKLVETLMDVTRNPELRPALLVKYLRDRAGLLEPRGVGVYAFPHRTFQEYLAACHLTERDDFPDNIADLLRSEPNRWREVTLLAGAKAVRGSAAMAWTLADALCYADPPAEKPKAQSGYWGALLAGEVLIANTNLENIPDRHQQKVECIRNWLLRTLSDNALPAVDRTQAGDALAFLGDTRFRPDAWHLPDEPLLGFVEIPAGQFQFGSDPKRDPDSLEYEWPARPISLPPYYISRFPVTVAQFRAFVEDSGYKVSDEYSLRGLPNHPVAWVNWYDALAYCDWLTKRLRAWEDIPTDLAVLLKEDARVTLPSEAEWEKAARGTDGRRYPWGDELDPDRANYDETGIGTTSAVGCFRNGASPRGVEDMSGNVWEWTRSLWGKDHDNPDCDYREKGYDPDSGRESLEVPADILRVLRGGAFWVNYGRLRCAYRGRPKPDRAKFDYGFRVVLRVLP